MQFLYGIKAHSIALIADAGHNLGDALGLLLAWGTYAIARWEPTDRYTYGFRSADVFGYKNNHVCGILRPPVAFIGTGGRLQSERMAAFNRNPRPQSSESAALSAAAIAAMVSRSGWAVDWYFLIT
jgi:Co/Zn/Cd efflux system component